MSEESFKRMAGMIVLVVLILASLSVVFMLQAKDIEVLSAGDNKFYYRLSDNVLKLIADQSVADNSLELVVTTSSGDFQIDMPNSFPVGSLVEIEIPIEQFAVAQRINLYYQGSIVHTWQTE